MAGRTPYYEPATANSYHGYWSEADRNNYQAWEERERDLSRGRDADRDRDRNWSRDRDQAMRERESDAAKWKRSKEAEEYMGKNFPYRKTPSRRNSGDSYRQNQESERRPPHPRADRPHSRAASIATSRSQTPSKRTPVSVSDLAAEIQRMMGQIGTEMMLTKKRNAVKADFDEAEQIWEATKEMETSFPAAAEKTKADYMKAKFDLESLDREIEETKSKISSTGLATAIDAVVRSQPLSPAVLEDRVVKAETKFSDLADEFRAFKEEIQESYRDAQHDSRSTMGQAQKAVKDIYHLETKLNKDVQSLESKARSNKANIAAETSALQTKVANLEAQNTAVWAYYNQQQMQLKDDSKEKESIIQKVKSLESKLNDVTTDNQGLHSKIQLLEEGEKEIRSKMQHLEEGENSKLQRLEQGEEKTRKLDKRVEVVHEDLINLDSNFKELDNEYGERVTILESRGAPAPAPAPAPEARAADIPVEASPTSITLSEEDEKLRESLGVSKSMFNALGKLPSRILVVETMQGEYESSLGEFVTEPMRSLEEKLNRHEEVLKSLGEGFKKNDDALQKSQLSIATAGSAGPTKLPKADVDQDAVDAIQRTIPELKNRLDGTDLALFHLDTRMSNIHTEHLARYIIGQLSSAYPNLPRVDGLLQQVQDGQVRQELALTHLTSQTSREGKDVSMKIQRLESEMGSKLSAGDTSSEAATLRQDVQNLKGFVESAVKKLESQVDEFEHLIVYDGNETLKEKLNATSSSVGLVEEEVEYLKTELNSVTSRYQKLRTLVSDATRVSPAAEAPSRPGSVRRRTSPSSPSATGRAESASNGTGRVVKKRKRYGAFLDDEDATENGG